MTKEKYGHIREGFQIKELEGHMKENGIHPEARSSFSGIFTEMLELSINYLYVNILSKKNDTKVERGTIAPGTAQQMKSVEKTYRMYSLVYPLFWLISKLDFLLLGSEGYVLMSQGRKE